MYNIIEKFILKMTKEDINNFAIKKGVQLNEHELNFIYEFIKKNYKEVLGNPALLNLNLYRQEFSEENFLKIEKIFNEYSKMYFRYL